MPLPIGVFVEVTRPFMLGGEMCVVGDKLELTHSEAKGFLRRDKVRLDPDAVMPSEGDEDVQDDDSGDDSDKPAKAAKAPRTRRAAAA